MNFTHFCITEFPREDNGEHKIIFCDGKTEQGPLHAPFNLGSDGGYVALTKKSDSGANIILDSVTYPAQAADTAFARIGRGGRWISTFPTPGLMNLPPGRMASFAGTSVDGPIVSLAFSGVTGKHYLIETTASLNPVRWTQQGTVTGEGVESIINYYAQDDARFYRVREQ